MARYDEDRLFVRTPFRHFRKTYSKKEVAWGAASFVCLLSIAIWVERKGMHPDPELYGEGAPLPSVVASVVDRGALPADLADSGWRETGLAQFDSSNLYEKINGREGYYKALGFERLFFVSLIQDRDQGDPLSIAVEMYDLGSASNALGALVGELPGGSVPVSVNGSLSVRVQNALMMARGRHYIRVIGSEDSAIIQRQLVHIKLRVEEVLDGARLPWGYAFFIEQLKVPAGQIRYMSKNAFSFAFAADVYAASLPKKKEGEWYVHVASSDEAAGAFAKALLAGFGTYGTRIKRSSRPWIRDRYIGTFATAVSWRRWVFGVRGVSTLAAAQSLFGDLDAAVRGLPEDFAENALRERKQLAEVAEPAAENVRRPKEGFIEH